MAAPVRMLMSLGSGQVTKSQAAVPSALATQFLICEGGTSGGSTRTMSSLLDASGERRESIMECNIWPLRVVRTHGRHVGRECSSAAASRQDLQTAWKRTRGGVLQAAGDLEEQIRRQTCPRAGRGRGAPHRIGSDLV